MNCGTSGSCVEARETINAPRDWENGRARCPRSRLSRPRLALELGAMHDAPRGRIERVAPMHGAAIIPQHEIADSPDVLPGKFSPRHIAPQLVQQGFGLRKFESG